MQPMAWLFGHLLAEVGGQGADKSRDRIISGLVNNCYLRRDVPASSELHAGQDTMGCNIHAPRCVSGTKSGRRAWQLMAPSGETINAHRRLPDSADAASSLR